MRRSITVGARTFDKWMSKSQRQINKREMTRKQYRKARYRKEAARFEQWSEKEEMEMNTLEKEVDKIKGQRFNTIIYGDESSMTYEGIVQAIDEITKEEGV